MWACSVQSASSALVNVQRGTPGRLPPAQFAPCLAATDKRTQRQPQDGTESKLIYKKKKRKKKRTKKKRKFYRRLNRRKVRRCGGRKHLDRRSRAPGGWSQALSPGGRAMLRCSQIFVLIWGTPSYHWVLSGLLRVEVSRLSHCQK